MAFLPEAASGGLPKTLALFLVCPDSLLQDVRRTDLIIIPSVHGDKPRIVSDNRALLSWVVEQYTGGGAYSWLNLVLYLVEKYAGRDIAVTTAKGFEIDLQRSSQSPFIIFSGQKVHEDLPVKKAQEFIEKNVHSRLTVDALASLVAVSRRNLERRFKKATGNTVMEYVQRVKIEAVKKKAWNPAGWASTKPWTKWVIPIRRPSA